MRKYKISLEDLIKDIEYYIPKYLDRVRIVPGKNFDSFETHPLVKYLKEKGTPYYFSENNSEKDEKDYEIRLEEMEEFS